MTVSYVYMYRSAQKDNSELLKAKNQLALDLERLLSHKEVGLCWYYFCVCHLLFAVIIK